MDDLLEKALANQHWFVAEKLVRPRYEVAPDDVDACLILGHVLIMTRRQGVAIQLFQEFLRRHPDALQVHKNLIVAQVQSGDVQAAFATVRDLITAFPHDPDLHLQMGALLQNAKRPDLAAASYRQAVEASPQDLPLRRGLMLLYFNLREEENALEQALILRDVPGGADDMEALAVRLQLLTGQSRWSEVQPDIDRLRALKSTILSESELKYGIGNLAMFFEDDPEYLCRLNRRPTSTIRPLPPTITPARTDGPLRIGYMSSDFHNHPVAQMLVEVLTYQRDAGHEIHLLALGEDDGSPVAGAVRQRAVACHSFFGEDDRTAALKIRQLRLDVLVDLNGSTGHCRPNILAMRPCHRQVLWLGCAISTGYQHYDAFLVDNIVAPPTCDQWCTEPLMRVPDCYHPISMGYLNNIEVKANREGWEVPDGSLLVGVIATNNRVVPEFIKRLVKTVSRLPHVYLALRSQESARPSVLAQCAAWGLPAERIRFMGRLPERGEYLARLGGLDLVVDTSPYGGHSTLGECLCLGVPVVVNAGTSIHSRVGASMVTAMGLTEAITHSLEEQLAQVYALLANPDLMSTWTSRFRSAKAKATVLNQSLAQNLILAYRSP